MSDLKACPFCGRIPDIEDCGEHRWFIRCKCGIAQDKLFFQKCDAVRAWNKRKELRVKDTNVPITDTISRQAAIDALAKFVPFAICDESTESYVNGLTDAYNLICQLPSAQPRKGMWIPINPGARIKHFFKCSLCGSSIDTFCISSDINYCPNCGHPMMRGEEE